jgi:hypothetical protein
VAVHPCLHATSNALGNYLRGIQQLPFLVTLDHLQVERKEELMPFLVVTLELGVRVFSFGNRVAAGTYGLKESE